MIMTINTNNDSDNDSDNHTSIVNLIVVILA